MQNAQVGQILRPREKVIEEDFPTFEVPSSNAGINVVELLTLNPLGASRVNTQRRFFSRKCLGKYSACFLIQYARSGAI